MIQRGEFLIINQLILEIHSLKDRTFHKRSFEINKYLKVPQTKYLRMNNKNSKYDK